MSLYLKYRPANFDQLIGQETLKAILLHQIKTDQVFHNYLFCGGRGTGKTSTARLLAQAVNCPKLSDGSPDFNDPVAQFIRDGKTIDVIEIDAASHTGVDNIREEIIEKAGYPPAQLKKKVYIIDEVHMLSKGAFNALLKIMEEPPSYVMFILATTELHKVPETIVSRCQVFYFRQMRQEQVVAHLQQIAEQESIPVSREGLLMIAKLAGGAMRDAIKYLEQVSMLGDVSPTHVSQFFGVVSEHTLQEILTCLITKRYDALYDILEHLAQNGTDMLQLVKDCMLACSEDFNKNPVLYAQLAHQFKDLHQHFRWYPNPVLAWKATFCDAHYDGQEGGHRHHVQSTSVTPQMQTASLSQVAGSVYSDGIQSSFDGEHLQTTIDSSQAPVAINFDVLLKSMISLCDKVIIKSGLKDYTIFDRIHGNVLEAIVINEQFYSLMNKPDILSYLSDLIVQAGYEQYKIKLTYMTKEDYFIKNLAT